MAFNPYTCIPTTFPHPAEVTPYASIAGAAIAAPSVACAELGMKPLEDLPAQWWNFYTNINTDNRNCLVELSNCVCCIAGQLRSLTCDIQCYTSGCSLCDICNTKIQTDCLVAGSGNTACLVAGSGGCVQLHNVEHICNCRKNGEVTFCSLTQSSEEGVNKIAQYANCHGSSLFFCTCSAHGSAETGFHHDGSCVYLGEYSCAYSSCIEVSVRRYAHGCIDQLCEVSSRMGSVRQSVEFRRTSGSGARYLCNLCLNDDNSGSHMQCLQGSCGAVKNDTVYSSAKAASFQHCTQGSCAAQYTNCVWVTNSTTNCAVACFEIRNTCKPNNTAFSIVFCGVWANDCVEWCIRPDGIYCNGFKKV